VSCDVAGQEPSDVTSGRSESHEAERVVDKSDFTGTTQGPRSWSVVHEQFMSTVSRCNPQRRRRRAAQVTPRTAQPSQDAAAADTAQPNRQKRTNFLVNTEHCCVCFEKWAAIVWNHGCSQPEARDACAPL